MISRINLVTVGVRCVCLGALVLSASVAQSQAIEIKAQAYRVDTPLPFGAPPATSPGSAAAIVTPAAAAVPAKTWEVTPTDGTLSRALLRWAAEANVNLVYEANADLPAVAVSYSGDFWSALGELLKDTASGSYPLHGCQYTNATRILHVTQTCDR